MSIRFLLFCFIATAFREIVYKGDGHRIIKKVEYICIVAEDRKGLEKGQKGN